MIRSLIFILFTLLILGTSLSLAQTNGESPVLRLKTGDTKLTDLQVDSLSTRSRTKSAGEEDALVGERYIIQFAEPLSTGQKQRLKRLGVSLEGYIPDYAYVVKLTEDNCSQVVQTDFVRHLAPIEKEWKLDTSLSVLVDDLFARRGRKQSKKTSTIQKYQKGLNELRTGLLDADRVCVSVATCRGVELKDAMNKLSGLGGVEVRRGAKVGASAVIDLVVPLESLREVSSLSLVEFVEDAPRGVLRNSTTGPVIQSGVNTKWPVWDNGLHGEGQIIGLIDSLPRISHDVFYDVEAVGATHRKFVAMINPPASAHSHGTFVAGVLAGDGLTHGSYDQCDGIAYGARISYASYYEVDSTPSLLITRLGNAHDNGARIHNNSWGDDSTTSYTTWCKQIDTFSYENEEDLVCFSATNYSALRSPENSRNVLAVGATSQYPNNNSHCYGGQGPTFDNRRKPEIYAPGCNVRSASSYGSNNFVTGSGTSYACPAICAAAALTRQYFLEGFYPSGSSEPDQELIPTGSLLKAVLLNGTEDMTGVQGYPSEKEGWGRLTLDKALCFPGDTRRLVIRDVRHANGLETGQTDSFDITVWGDDELRVTLVYADVPPASLASSPVVNDLDLLVTGPESDVSDGNVFRGNYFENGQSVAGGYSDALNNVEQVSIASPVSGKYKVEVIGTAVNGVVDGSIAPQGYAVVVSGNIIDGVLPNGLGYADIDGDGDRDLNDFAAFQSCFSGVDVPYWNSSCVVFDIDRDEDVDLIDYDVWRAVMTGPKY